MLPDRSLLIGQKIVENVKIEKFKMRHFEQFSNIVPLLNKDKDNERLLLMTRKLATLTKVFFFQFGHRQNVFSEVYKRLENCQFLITHFSLNFFLIFYFLVNFPLFFFLARKFFSILSEMKISKNSTT